MIVWAIIFFMSVLAAALLLPAFIRPRPLAKDNTRQENIAAARARLQALGDLALPEEETAEQINEIKKRLLDEADNAPDNNNVAAPSAPDKLGAAIILIMLIPIALALYSYVGTPNHNVKDHLTDVVEKLKVHVEQNPQDIKSLILLSKVMKELGKEEEAKRYLKRAMELQKSQN